jgi:hypothetical protein
VLRLTRLARGTVADMAAQLGHACVTWLALVGGQLVPHGLMGAGPVALRRWERRKTLVHHVLLLVVIPQAS